MAQSAASAPATLQRHGPDSRKPPERRFPSRHTYGAVDLGTNNCRLLIARAVDGGFTVVDAFSRIVRLGEGVSQTGALSAVAMDRTIEALKVCAGKMQRRGVSLMRSVATEACRRAINGLEFLERSRAETGVDLEIISTAEEAKLAFSGCMPLLDRARPYAIVFDIGGGTASGRPVKAIQVGGPLGAYVPESQWDLPLDYDAYTAKSLVLGHGGTLAWVQGVTLAIGAAPADSASGRRARCRPPPSACAATTSASSRPAGAAGVIATRTARCWARRSRRWTVSASTCPVARRPTRRA